MKLHACRHCGARLRTYTELQEQLKTHPNVCVSCYRVFSNRSILLAHTCKVGEYLCEICQRSYSTQTKLARHKRETSCRHSLPLEAKRQKLMPPIEDLEAPPPPPLVDEYGSELQDVIIQHWGSIRTHTSHGPVQSRYNIRLMTSDIGGLELGHIFAAQTTAFKINISYGFILRNRTSGRYRYYHSSCNCCGRYLDEPSLITNAETFENFLERIKEPDILKWALSQRPNSDWVVELVTNATIFVNRILQHPIGCVGMVLPPHVKYNQSVTVLEKYHYGRPYVDNLCLFRCMGLRFYPYRATFDFECFFDGEDLPANSDRVQWIARHVPLSVSVASNVPGHEPPRCYVTDGDSDKLVGTMMRGLSAISDTAFDMLIPSYDNVLNELEVRKEAWDEAERKALKKDDDEELEMEAVKTNPYKTLIGQLLGWLHQLPVIGFNSGKYDLNVIKQFFVPYLLKPSKQEDNDDGNDEDEEEDDDDDDDDETRFVIKRQNTFMCFSTKKLKFIDISNFLAPGYSYDKYLKAYGCELQKGHFPYEYMDGIGKLEDSALPPQEAFYSRLKNEGISDEDYARCQAV